MKKLNRGISDYIELRRTMGHKYYKQSKVLESFSDFMNAQKKKTITLKIAKEFCLSGEKKVTYNHGRKLAVIRDFCLYWKEYDSQTEIWQRGYWSVVKKRSTPHIYTSNEIERIIHESLLLYPKNSFKSVTLYTIFGLVISCGLRISEALALRVNDIDIKMKALTIRKTKFNKIRKIPIDETVIKELKKYLNLRRKIEVETKESFFFIQENTRSVTHTICHKNFRKILERAKIESRARPERSPCIHDLRHTFIVKTLERWYKNGEDVESLLPSLSAYVGHVRPQFTFWYMSITPELMSYARNLLDQFTSEKLS